MKQKYFLLIALFGATLSANTFAIVPGACNDGEYGDSQSSGCYACPANYNNHYTSFHAVPTIEDCCIDDMTYDAATNMCVPVASAGLTNSSACDTENLGTSTDGSTASVEAVWDANTININWYNGETRVARTTCEYDGTITLPQEPTKVGYTFGGWVLKQN